jgi:hypothetical protein
MAKLKLQITSELQKEIAEEANHIWPGAGTIAVRRLLRDSVRRLWRYCNGNGRSRN